MIARISKSLNEKEKGFTLIELLVVVIIIGILSAIAIPVFMNQRQKAVDAGVKSDLRTIANEVESYYVDHQEYPDGVTGGNGTKSVTIGTGGETVSLSDAETIITYAKDGQKYTITGKNSTKGSGDTFKYDSAAGGLQAGPVTEAPAGNG